VRFDRPGDGDLADAADRFAPLAAVLLAPFPAVIRRVTSPGGSAQKAEMTSAPSLPGLPLGRRSSTSRRLANRLGARKLDSSAFQSGSRWLPSASNTSRSLMPCRRAAARTASAASSTRNGSGPAIR
jgi:hypothetical protein